MRTMRKMTSNTEGDRQGILKDINLRPLVAADQPFLVSLYASTRSDELDTLPWDKEQKDMFVTMQFSAQTQHYHGSYPHAQSNIILRNKEAVGRIIVNEDAQAFTLVDVSLLPAHRGHGIGTYLLRELLRKADEATKPVRLHVLLTNPARRLYERLGFSVVHSDSLYCEMIWTATDGMQS